jgi:hypothetical protein
MGAGSGVPFALCAGTASVGRVSCHALPYRFGDVRIDRALDT